MSIYYYDKTLNKLVEGCPPDPNPKYGTAPFVIFDSMPPTYHEAAGRMIESRKEWELTDKQYNTITFGNIKDAKPKVDWANEEKKKKAEYRNASKAALEAYRANPTEVKQRLQKISEEQTKVLKKAKLDKVLKDTGLKYD